MNTSTGEYLVGAYLELIEGCDVVAYNIKFPGTGMKSMNEFDILALDFKHNTAYLCEVATHMLNLAYGNSSAECMERVRKKYENQKAYAAQCLQHFESVRYQFWAMRTTAQQAAALGEIEGLELVLNTEFTKNVLKLSEYAAHTTKQTTNPVFRTLQILSHLKKK